MPARGATLAMSEAKARGVTRVGIRCIRLFAFLFGVKCADQTPLSLSASSGYPRRVPPALGRFLRWLIARSPSISLTSRVLERRKPLNGFIWSAAGDQPALSPIPSIFIFAVSAFSVPAALAHPMFPHGSERPELNRSFNMVFPFLLRVVTALGLRAPGKSLEMDRTSWGKFLSANVSDDRQLPAASRPETKSDENSG